MDMLTFSFHPESKIPLYQQLYNFIKEEIQSGRIPYNTKLPSKRRLSSYLSLSQNTIQSAYDQLIEEGYIIPMERKGFFVCQLDNIQKLRVSPAGEIQTDKFTQPKAVYDFSYHGVDMPTFPFSIWRRISREVINEYDPELLKLGDSVGCSGLRASIAEYLHQSRGVNCLDSQVVISSGTEILFESLIKLFDEDCIYGIENPGYEKLNQLFTGNRAQFRAVSIDRNGMIPEEIRKSNANILCITPAHQFPSGEIMPISRRIQLLNWANETDNRYLIEDDYDSEFKYSGKPVPALQGLDSNGKVIYMGSISKSLAPTIRVSYMVLPPPLMKKYNERLSYILCPVPIMEQKILYRFIRDGYFERHLNKMRNIYRKKREALVAAITEADSKIRIIGADAGLHLLLQIDNHMTEEELIACASQNGVKVYGISKYYSDKSKIGTNPAIVIGYASMSEEEIRKAVRLLVKAWL